MKRTAILYAVSALMAVAVNNIYGLFGHGVNSTYMTWMFLYPLIGGVIFFIMIYLIIPGITKIKGYRIFYNCYNSGIATLTMGSFLKGILQIAGTASSYTVVFDCIGWIFIGAALILLLKFKCKVLYNLTDN